MEKINVHFRLMELNDWSAVNALSAELGYSLSEVETQAQIEIVLRREDHYCLVAECQHKIVGYLHAFEHHGIISASYVEIAALVVTEKSRGEGIGRGLINAFQADFPHLDVRVRCNVKRLETHLFYRKLGFIETKEQKVFHLKSNQ